MLSSALREITDRGLLWDSFAQDTHLYSNIILHLYNVKQKGPSLPTTLRLENE